MEVLEVHSVSDIYPEAAQAVQKERWGRLLSTFKKRYGGEADFVSRSPGRVNIIGEHIDYSLYEVIPMAVTVDVLMAVSLVPGSDDDKAFKITVANVDDSKYPTREFSVPFDSEVEIDAKEHEWSNYFRAGLRGAWGLLKQKEGARFRPVGMNVLVDGSVPQGGGLSSSAAFVCASALAVLKANKEDHKVNKKELVELAVVSERAVGVNSGGMDQSASVFGLRGSALYVTFKPELDARTITFPETEPELAFVVAQSFVTSDKQVTAPVCYNLRVVECTLAAACLAKIFKLEKALPKDAGPLGISLRGFHDTYYEQENKTEDNTKITPEEMQEQLTNLIDLVDNYLPQEQGYTRDEIAQILNTSVEEVDKRFLSSFPVRAERFKIRQRALHVFTEARRVLRFMDLLNSPPTKEDGKVDSAQLTQGLGGLLNETQDSCRDVYECSCPELDELCELARSAGAYGSRLTGAGWGGCSVHLVPANKVDKVKAAWEEKFYRKHYPNMSPEQLAEAVVVSRPGTGSCVYHVSSSQEQ